MGRAETLGLEPACTQPADGEVLLVKMHVANEHGRATSPSSEPDAAAIHGAGLGLGRSEYVWAVGALLLFRCAQLFALGELVQWREFAYDVGMHLKMAASPLAILLGESVYGQYPPLLPVLTTLVFTPLRIVASDFVTARLGYVIFEAIALFATVGLLRAVAVAPKARRIAVLAWIVGPVCWMTSVFMAQDETVAAAFIAASLWLVAVGRIRAGLLVCSFGVVTAKVFLLLPLLAMTLLLTNGRFWQQAPRNAIWASLPIIAVYVPAFIAAAGEGNPLPLIGFTPAVGFGVNAWVPIVNSDLVSLDLARRASGILCIVFALIPVALIQMPRHGHDRVAKSLALVELAMLMWVLLLFYHINPEYYLMVLVPLTVLAPSVRNWILLHVALTIPWSANFFYAIYQAQHRAPVEGKAAFLRAYQAVTSTDPAVLHIVAIYATTAVTLVLAVGYTVRIRATRLSNP